MREILAERLGQPRIHSSLRLAAGAGSGLGRFVPEDARVRYQIEIPPEAPDHEDLVFEKAGPREWLYFDPARTRAAIVTCGGLCPGLNNVIRSLVLELHFNYGVPEILGIRHGFQGLNPAVGQPPVRLTLDSVSKIHQEGGTVLGSSRGKQDLGVMVDTLKAWGVHQLFCIGGDGTQRGSHAIHEEAVRRGYELAVVGIPKTIDNDLQYCTRTFGVATAIEKAQEVVRWAHTEAIGAPRGIGLVKVMGRDAGFIACGAALASQEANFVLIPEQPFAMGGSGGLLAALERRMDERGHALIVVAEGAGQHLFPESVTGRDASGNRRYHDIGAHLKAEIVAHFARIDKPVDLKYIDPSYILRCQPANCDDSLLCDQLARRAADAAMAGKTDVLVCFLHNAFVHVPIPMAVAEKRRVNLEGRLWNAVLASTGQPERYPDPPAAGER